MNQIRNGVSFHVISNNKRIEAKVLLKSCFNKSCEWKTCLVDLLNNNILVPSDLYQSWYKSGNTNQLFNNFHFRRNQMIHVKPRLDTIIGLLMELKIVIFWSLIINVNIFESPLNFWPAISFSFFKHDHQKLIHNQYSFPR